MHGDVIEKDHVGSYEDYCVVSAVTHPVELFILDVVVVVVVVVVVQAIEDYSAAAVLFRVLPVDSVCIAVEEVYNVRKVLKGVQSPEVVCKRLVVIPPRVAVYLVVADVEGLVKQILV